VARTVSQPSIATTSVPDGTVGVAYSAQIQALGGELPYTWTIASGALPAGLTLNASTGAITGTPTATGTCNFTVQVADSETPAQTATAQFQITISLPVPVLAFSPTTIAIAAPGQQGSTNFTAGNYPPDPGSTGPESLTITGLPAGATWSATTTSSPDVPVIGGTITFQTTAHGTDATPPTGRIAMGLLLPGLLGIGLCGRRRGRRRGRALLLVLCIVAAAGLTACNWDFHATEPVPGMPAGTYPLVVTLTQNGDTAQAQLTLVVH
jgi:hypothetical protein